MRLLNNVEKKVIVTALEFEENHHVVWGAPNLQFIGWDNISERGYRSKALGISAAIQFLKRRGYVENCKYGGRGVYRLTEKGQFAARRLAANP